MIDEFKDINLLGDRVIVMPDSEEKNTNSGIIIVPSSNPRKKTYTGTVVKVGRGKWIVDGLGIKRKDMEVREGDTVVFPRYSGITTKAIEKSIIILSQNDILAKVERS